MNWRAVFGTDQPDQFGTVIPHDVMLTALNDYHERVLRKSAYPNVQRLLRNILARDSARALDRLLTAELVNSVQARIDMDMKMEKTTELQPGVLLPATVECLSFPYPDRIRKVRKQLRLAREALKSKDEVIEALRKEAAHQNSEEMQFLKRERGDAKYTLERLRKQVDDQAMEINRLKSVPEALEKQLAAVSYELRVPIGSTDPLHIIARKMRETAESGVRAMQFEREALALIESRSADVEHLLGQRHAFDPITEVKRVLEAADKLIGNGKASLPPINIDSMLELNDAVIALREWRKRWDGPLTDKRASVQQDRSVIEKAIGVDPKLYEQEAREVVRTANALIGESDFGLSLDATTEYRELHTAVHAMREKIAGLPFHMPTQEAMRKASAVHGGVRLGSTHGDLRLKLDREKKRADAEAKESAAAVERAERWEKRARAGEHAARQQGAVCVAVMQLLQGMPTNYLGNADGSLTLGFNEVGSHNAFTNALLNLEKVYDEATKEINNAKVSVWWRRIDGNDFFNPVEILGRRQPRARDLVLLIEPALIDTNDLAAIETTRKRLEQTGATVIECLIDSAMIVLKEPELMLHEIYVGPTYAGSPHAQWAEFIEWLCKWDVREVAANATILQRVVAIMTEVKKNAPTPAEGGGLLVPKHISDSLLKHIGVDVNKLRPTISAVQLNPVPEYIGDVLCRVGDCKKPATTCFESSVVGLRRYACDDHLVSIRSSFMVKPTQTTLQQRPAPRATS